MNELKNRAYCNKVRLNNSGYEVGPYGQYYGVGAKLYRVTNHIGDILYECRAWDRVDALQKFKEAKTWELPLYAQQWVSAGGVR